MASFGFASDGTMKQMVEAKKAMNTILQVMKADAMASVSTNMQAIKHIVQLGNASTVFSIGDRIVYDWEESVSGVTYEMPHNVVSFEEVTLSDGDVVPGMWLETNYASALAVPFDAKEAIYYAAEGLSAGAYSLTFGYTFGKCTAGETYYFTLENDVPEGGQIVFAANLYLTAPEGTKLNIYAKPELGEDGDTSALETILETVQMSATAIDGATDLGTITRSGSGALNSLHRAVYGYNRWSESAIRQYLNSSAGIGEWWSAQNDWDRPPAELFKYPGYMSGYDSTFLSALQKVKVTTALETVCTNGGGSEDTYDYFFLPSLEQMYIKPQSEGVEGSYFPYWKKAVGSEETVEKNVAGVYPLTYAIDMQTSAVVVRLRSAQISSACYAWYAGSSGTVNNSASTIEYRCAPVCVIC